jgi:Mor family transcriptional regulator
METPEAIKHCDELGLIDKIALRDYFMRNQFREFKAAGMKPGKIIKLLMKKYNLSWSRVRNIVYKDQKGNEIKL